MLSWKQNTPRLSWRKLMMSVKVLPIIWCELLYLLQPYVIACVESTTEKENQPWKISTRQKPRVSSRLKLSKVGCIWCRLISITGLLSLRFCLLVSKISGEWLSWSGVCTGELMAWCLDKNKWCRPMSLLRWRWMGVGPAMASTSPEGEVRKAPVMLLVTSPLHQRFENQYYLISNAAAQWFLNASQYELLCGRSQVLVDHS